VHETESLQSLLRCVREGEMTVDEALAYLGESIESKSLSYANVDHLRARRTGFPEVIYCPGKTPAQIAGIFARLAAHESIAMATRATREDFAAVRAAVPQARFDEEARIIALETAPLPRVGLVAVVCAGTADGPVAAEAAAALDLMGNGVVRLDDVGIAGLHRVLAHVGALRTANVVTVIAGMDGALPAIVAGLTSRPIVAIPTSVGYGSSFGGLAALLSMLNACSCGVTVVNIDGGFAGACAASRINHAVATGQKP
jgi:pyridinium-3,5-biscarboxylic acid mononucleotide synthase